MSDENRESPSHPTLAPTTWGDFPDATVKWGPVVYRLVVVGLLACIAYDLKWGRVDVGTVQSVGMVVSRVDVGTVRSVVGRVDVGNFPSTQDVSVRVTNWPIR